MVFYYKTNQRNPTILLKINKMYNFRDSKSNIINILKSQTPIEKKNAIPVDSAFTYENGILTWVSAIFVDIENSTKLFNTKNEKLARLMRAFTSEVICIFQDNKNYNQIGIRGDCVYSIYDIKTTNDLVGVFKIAVRLNTFLKMFNKIITNYGYKKIKAGIGIGCDEDLIIKAGRTGTGINDKIWIGKAVVDASNLSSIAARNGVSNIAISPLFYSNAIDLLLNRNKEYAKWINVHKANGTIDFYHCDVVQNDFNDWINNGMK